MILQACLNGARPGGFHARLPISRAALVEDAARCVAAGANELHLHPRDVDGSESLLPEVVDTTVAALRTRLPGTAFGVSTGDWIEPDQVRRMAAIGAWRQRPDYASVNLAEPSAPAVIEVVLRGGMGVEAGIASVADVRRLALFGFGPLCFRVLIEVEQPDPGAALAEAAAIAAALDEAGLHRPRLLHGVDATVWPLVRRAAGLGYSVRVGLEDGGQMEDGRPAAGNAAMVAAAAAIMRSPG